MAYTLDQFFQDAVDKSYDEKVQMAKIARKNCLAVLKKQGLDDKFALNLLVSFLATAIAADGEFTEPEKQMVRDVFDDVNPYQVSALVTYTDEKVVEWMDQFVDSLDADAKSDFCLLAVFIAAVDDTINKDELTYLVKLMQ